jgi:spermidine synthase
VTTRAAGWRWRVAAAALAVALGTSLAPAAKRPAAAEWSVGRDVLVHETRSEFSHVRIRDRGSRRTLYFVRDSGQEVVETSIDLRAPHLLQIEYTRLMFVSLLYRPEPEACLIVGLGGGAMVRFLNHFFPQVRVDVVEIDPVVVAVARQYFGTEPRPGTRIFTEDGLAYLRQTRERYDVIYMDAFLKPGGDTDSTGVPLRLKTEAFLKSLHERLRPGGLVAFNINASEETSADLATIRSAFPAVDVYQVPGSGTIVAVGAVRERMPGDDELRRQARALDRRRDHGFSFKRLLAYRGA